MRPPAVKEGRDRYHTHRSFKRQRRSLNEDTLRRVRRPVPAKPRPETQAGATRERSSAAPTTRGQHPVPARSRPADIARRTRPRESNLLRYFGVADAEAFLPTCCARVGKTGVKDKKQNPPPRVSSLPVNATPSPLGRTVDPSTLAGRPRHLRTSSAKWVASSSSKTSPFHGTSLRPSPSTQSMDLGSGGLSA